ncbi:MAG TPA: FAD-binding and (Fe-S)-binding domain-containing protein [Burkholderiales bacterium]|nr:FAD-binding and (Fe-S)-binding domain-containing protein [Burkholderiales bacterium]
MSDWRGLAADLARAVSGEVRFDAGARAAYSADASNYRQVPIGVVLPRSVEDVVAAMAVCRAHGAPVLARGGGTAQNGQSVNVAVVIDCSKYLNRVLSVDPRARRALVEPGAVCDALRDAAERHGLTFAPDPATHSRCTLGGMIANNSCGPHSVMAGKTVENIERLEVLTYDGARFWCGPTSDAEFARIVAAGGRQGEIYARLKTLAERYAERIRSGFPKIRRRVSGYNLDQLLPGNGFNVARALVGSEGTCAFTLAAEAQLVHSPRARVLLVLGFPDIYQAGDVVPEILAARPIACEGLDEKIIGGLRERRLRLEDIALLPVGRAWLMCEFGADEREAALAQARALEAALAGRTGVSAWLIDEPATIARMWAIRETGASATSLALGGRGPDPVVGWEDAAVDPLRLGDYLREFQRLIDDFGYRTSLYGHFGDGCIHARITFELRTPEGVAHWRRFLGEAAQLVVKYGGSLSGEHGDGQAKAEFLPAMFGPELMAALREFKAIWDPENRMNPGKLVSAAGEVNRATDHLRLGPEYRPVTLATRLAFRSEVGDGFTRATEHCIGMGKCRAGSGGTMCPSYRATGEERYSTRGRARLLNEMLRGEVITSGWQSEEVKEALDWCLACKGCRSDCPAHTDMASYKAEFLSHYYEKHLRPVQAHSMGRIGQWAPLAARAPRLVNFLTQTPGLAALAKRVAGVAPQRALPRFAPRTFKSEFNSRSAGGDAVILFADSFNNHFRPDTAHAAARVLEAAGCTVEVAREAICCGRPYYDFGMLGQSRDSLEKLLAVLGPRLEAGSPVVVLEPGCLSVFRDELRQLLPDDTRAQRLARQAVTLAELLRTRGWRPKPIGGRALLHGHCHQKALGGTAAELALLREAQVEVSAPDTGCCGMSGSFGFKPQHYEASRRIAELALLPALRAAPDGTAVVADGFSCREQIEDLAGRETLHLAQLLARSLDG